MSSFGALQLSEGYAAPESWNWSSFFALGSLSCMLPRADGAQQPELGAKDQQAMWHLPRAVQEATAA